MTHRPVTGARVGVWISHSEGCGPLRTPWEIPHRPSRPTMPRSTRKECTRTTTRFEDPAGVIRERACRAIEASMVNATTGNGAETETSGTLRVRPQPPRLVLLRCRVLPLGRAAPTLRMNRHSRWQSCHRND